MSFRSRTIAVACLLGVGITTVAGTLIGKKGAEAAAPTPTGAVLQHHNGALEPGSTSLPR